MPHYCVWSDDDPEGEAYWVLAPSCQVARHLVALNVDTARQANDPNAFDCLQDDKKNPPEGLIYRQLNGPIAIARRS